MRIIKSFTSLHIVILFSIIAVASICFAQENQKIDVAALLAQTDYKYVKVKEDLWRVPDLPNDGLNFKKLDFFFQPNPSKQSLRISVFLGTLTMPEDTPEFKDRLANLNKQYKPTEFVITKASLFLERDVPAQNLDKKMFVEAIEKLAGEANRTYPDLARFIEPRKESLGPGIGGGIGAGDGDGSRFSVYNTPQSSPSSTATTVDSKPKLLYKARAEYTLEARDNKIQGEVVLRALIGDDGLVKQVRVIRGLPDGLTEKAIEAARKSKFQPAMKDGKPIAYPVLLTYTFALY